MLTLNSRPCFGRVIIWLSQRDGISLMSSMALITHQVDQLISSAIPPHSLSSSSSMADSSNAFSLVRKPGASNKDTRARLWQNRMKAVGNGNSSSVDHCDLYFSYNILRAWILYSCHLDGRTNNCTFKRTWFLSESSLFANFLPFLKRKSTKRIKVKLRKLKFTLDYSSLIAFIQLIYEILG